MHTNYIDFSVQVSLKILGKLGANMHSNLE